METVISRSFILSFILDKEYDGDVDIYNKNKEMKSNYVIFYIII